MSNLIPINRDNQIEPGRRVIPVPRSVARALNRLEGRTYVALAEAQAEGLITRTKEREMDASTEEAIIGHASLLTLIDTVAGGNPITHEECRSFLTVNMAIKQALLKRQADTYLS